MTPQEQTVAALALARQLSPGLEGVEHGVVLAALMTLFRVVALQHPCCMKSAAEQCMTVGLELVVQHAKQQPPSGASIH